MPEKLTPPRGASLLLRLLAGEGDFPQIEGDLREEFHRRTLADAVAARRWYRRELYRNVWALARGWKTIAVVVMAVAAAVVIGWQREFAILLRREPLGHMNKGMFLMEPVLVWVIAGWQMFVPFGLGFLLTRAAAGRDWL